MSCLVRVVLLATGSVFLPSVVAIDCSTGSCSANDDVTSLIQVKKIVMHEHQTKGECRDLKKKIAFIGRAFTEPNGEGNFPSYMPEQNANRLAFQKEFVSSLGAAFAQDEFRTQLSDTNAFIAGCWRAKAGQQDACPLNPRAPDLPGVDTWPIETTFQDAFTAALGHEGDAETFYQYNLDTQCPGQTIQNAFNGMCEAKGDMNEDCCAQMVYIVLGGGPVSQGEVTDVVNNRLNEGTRIVAIDTFGGATTKAVGEPAQVLNIREGTTGLYAARTFDISKEDNSQQVERAVSNVMTFVFGATEMPQESIAEPLD